MRKSTLGPFPKTRSLREISSLPSTDGDALIGRIRETAERDVQGADGFKGMAFIIALVMSTRSESPSDWLRAAHFISVPALPSADDLTSALSSFCPASFGSGASAAVIQQVMSQPSEQTLFGEDPWLKWKAFDGAEFCVLARSCFFEYLRRVLESFFPDALEEAALFAYEASIITQAFSARWFNSCARYQIPEDGSVRWYFRHCMGKLDLELERELSDWDESSRWRAKKSYRTLNLEFDSPNLF